MSIKYIFTLLIILILPGCDEQIPAKPQKGSHATLAPKQQLGKHLFFDTNLSDPAGQACVSCHSPLAGFSSPDLHEPVTEGAHRGRFGNRNAPTAAYASFVPALHFDKKEQHYVGGLFLDGRVNSLELQVPGPLLNPVEMAAPNQAFVVERVRESAYVELFKQVYGKNALQDSSSIFLQIADAIAAYERSSELNPFDSEYDAFLAGKVTLSAPAQRGLKVYEDEKKGNCAACHPHKPAEDDTPPLFTDFTYDNLGVPGNLANPFYLQPKQFNPAGSDYADLGLGAVSGDKKENGKFRVPTLRNIALTEPYMHNGVFASLREVLEFYNTRDVDKKWAEPEVAENVNKDELGDLKLSQQEIDDLLVFLKTLSDQNLLLAVQK